MAKTGPDIAWADRDPDGAGVGLPALSSPEKSVIECLIQDGSEINILLNPSMSVRVL